MLIKRFVGILILLVLLCSIRIQVRAQQVNSLYFMENIPVRHYLNPSFQPTNNYYLSLPVIGFTQFDIGNNSFSLKDLIYKQNGQTITFFNPQGNIDRFYNVLKRSTVVRADFQTNLLSFGVRNSYNYWTFSVSEKVNGMGSLPKDLFKLSFYGTPDTLSNTYNFTTLQTDVSVYTEAALGYSRKLDEQWTLGGKVKLLYGSANFSNTNNRINLQAGIDSWEWSGNGSVNVSSPVRLNVGPDIQTITYQAPTALMDWLKPSGIGTGIDFGAEYQLNENIRLSGAILDLGFINWTRNVHNYQYGLNYTFNGISQFDSNSNVSTFQDVYNRFVSGQLTDSLLQLMRASATTELTTGHYITGTTSRLNLGAEYILFNNELSIGLLSSSRFLKKTITEEITVSVNARPYKWLNGTLSSSLLNGRISSLGGGLGLKTGFIHWFVAADYIPFQKVTIALSDIGVNNSNMKVAIPYNASSYNFSVGVNFVFENIVNSMKSKKIQASKRTGLRSTSSTVTRNLKKIYRSPTRIDSRGLNKKKSIDDCKCDWK